MAQQLGRTLNPQPKCCNYQINLMKKFLTKLESSKIANVSKRTVENWMENGLLSYIKIRGIVRIPEDELLQALERHLVKGRNSRTKGSANGH